MRRALVTGAAGFLGSHLTDALLALGVQVIGVDNFFRGHVGNLPAASGNNFRFVEHDLALSVPPILAGDVDAVFHLAAVNGTEWFYEMPREVLRRNIRALENMLAWAKTRGVELFVYASSSEVYGRLPMQIPTPETAALVLDSVTNPRYSYAASKVHGEYLVRYEGEGMRRLILRYFNIYGPRMDWSVHGQVVPEIIRKALTEPEIRLIGPGTQTRSFCYIDDAVDLTVRLASLSRDEFAVFNVGNPDEITIRVLCSHILEACGGEKTVVPGPAREGDTLRRSPDMRAASQVLGDLRWTSLSDGLRLTVPWYRSRVEAPAVQGQPVRS